MSQKSKQSADKEPVEETVTSVRWDDSTMQTSYANVLNVINTREEFSLFFGMNQTIDPTGGGLTVKLANRVVMTPHAAKRLAVLIGDRVADYERRFGELNITS